MICTLLVEDDRALASGTEYALSEEGMQVVCADTFTRVQEILGEDSHRFDCVLLDVMLPDADGYQVCQWIKERWPLLPVLFLTALSDEGNVVRGLNLGGDDYITKPFRMKELVARIHAQIRGSQRRRDMETLMEGAVRQGKEKTAEHSGRETVSEPEGKLQIDHNQFAVLKMGQRVNLTPSEYRLLSELAAHPGRVLPRQKLIEWLWDVDGAFVDDNTLSVYIRRLREKLSELGEESRIQTMRGVGYYWKGKDLCGEENSKDI